MSDRLLVIASNLHRGGAVQVAASLVEELAALPGFRVDEVLFELSPAVAANVDASRLAGTQYEILVRRPIQPRLWWKDARRQVDCTFVVFGPAWFPVRGRRRITGYADVTSIYPSPVVLPFSDRLRRAVRGWFSRRQLRRFHEVVVETDALANRLIFAVPALAGRTHVVANCVSDQVLRGTASIETPKLEPNVVRLAYTTASYPHKNLAFLPPLASALRDLGIQVRYLLTLPVSDWEELGPELRDCSDNVGPVRLEQLKAVHDASDAIIFPSLLEAASATPLEALALGTPLLASDRDFVRSVVGNAATYFDPIDPVAAAAVIAEALQKVSLLADRVEAGKRVFEDLPDAGDRARAFAVILGRREARCP